MGGQRLLLKILYLINSGYNKRLDQINVEINKNDVEYFDLANIRDRLFFCWLLEEVKEKKKNYEKLF